MSFRRKTYPEVAESLLNRLLGGVSGEAHPYPPAKATREPQAGRPDVPASASPAARTGVPP